MYMEFYSLVIRLTVNISKYRNWFNLSFVLIFYFDLSKGMMDLRSINAWFFCFGLSLKSKERKRNYYYWNTLLNINRNISDLLEKAYSSA